METTKCLGNFFPRFLKLYILNRWDDVERCDFRIKNSNEYLQTQRGKLYTKWSNFNFFKLKSF